MTYRVAPCTVKAALKMVKGWHRHLPDLQGGLFAAKVVFNGEDVAVGVFGNPAREWQGTGRGIIARCAAREDLPPIGNHAAPACTMLYGALCRAAKALGYHEAWTYTLPHEPGTSLRAAGFIDMGMTDGGEHDRPSRRRKPAKHPEPKRRWVRRLLVSSTEQAPK
jgi:hypothetical protein